ncbi:MAG: electron transport complex subunit E [Candidatus Margulisiibacteriota bacterium]|nr:MAG: electron transport complex subunit RsxE [Candidatus Margulisbacteria bacterium GWD2_39_127]OGI03836.1 MAG: electron transport complex subunit RsxE [Candidatus Margulisbacteria bacterium GWF2_38_17]OGI06395.1 MAG: electron transport complex subunit RsxE [Candidatus Margulisbacteria bacterium GWE2_39_32]PZM79422.1 MAG: electron transport complex subunit E [Candidatus Margulisiibacteriota bacterium]HAR63526.1 electron transport complex subunit RsxE [Candidatus Margulisiibacteriota bacteriu
MNLFKILKNGIITENPTTKLVLGTCPTLAVTTSAINGIGMGISTTAVLIGSNFVISILRKSIPAKVRIPAFVIVIASFVTIVQMLLKAYVPSIDKALGIFIPLIVVNCIILARAETFASKNSPLASAFDGLGMGIGFTLALLVMGSFREILGNGTILGLKLFGESYSPALIMILPPGGFLAFGMLIGLTNKLSITKITASGCSGCKAPCKTVSETQPVPETVVRQEPVAQCSAKK